MKFFLLKSDFFLLAILFFASVENVNAQYTITGTAVNASTLSCGTFTGNIIIYVGDGTASTTLVMNANLDLYNSCTLGAIQFIVRNNSSVDFPPGNNRLILPLGSSLVVESGGNLIGGSCNASERIYIATDLIASCNGGAGADFSFLEIVNNGGFNTVQASASQVCSSGTSTINVSVIPKPSATTTYNLFSVVSGGSSISSVTSTTTPYSATLTSPSISTSTTYYISSTTGTSTTPRRAVTITVSPTTVAGTVSANQSICSSSTPTAITLSGSIGTIQWQSSTDNITFANISGETTGTLSGATMGVLTATRYYRAVVQSGVCSSANSGVVTVTVRSLVDNVSDGFSSSSFCAGVQATMTFDANNGSGVLPYTIVYKNNTTNATTSVAITTASATTFNITPNPSVTTNYTLVSITDSNGCVRTSSFGDDTATATINTVPTTPSVGTITQPTCTLATGSLDLSGLPASGTWTLTRSGSSSGATTGTGTSSTISGLATGTYNFTVTLTSCTSLVSANVVINTQPATPTTPLISITQPTCTLSTGTITCTIQNSGETYSFDNGSTFQTGNSKSGLTTGSYSVIIKSTSGCNSSTSSATVKSDTNTWSGSVWSNGTAPISTENIVFNQSYNSSSDLVGCSCQVNNSITVVINSLNTLTITNGVTVVGTGSLTFEDSASLVQINNVANSGNIIYKRSTTAIKNTDYTYWSSPVGGFTLGSLSPNTKSDKFYSFNSATENWKQESIATSMGTGIGYIVRGPETSSFMNPNPPSAYQASFVGVPNNGYYQITGVVANTSYLLGNPYPSALNADTFLDDNQNVMDGTLYFWTHNTPIAINTPNPGSGILAYSGNDYASYNRTGGVATAAAPSASTGGINVNIPSGKIASGQGFFASSKLVPTDTKIIFNNSMRVGVGGITGNNSQFFKTSNPKSKVTTLEKHRIWINLTNNQGAFKQTLLGYLSNATNEYEGRFDGLSYDGNDFLDFYSVLKDKNLTIQGRALPFDQEDKVELGFKVALAGTFNISIDSKEGVFADANQAVFLEDKVTNSLFDLKNGNYTFTTEKGTFNNRFVLRYTDKTLGLDEINKYEDSIVLYSNNYKTIIIKNNTNSILNSVLLFNIDGQNIIHWDVKDIAQTTLQLPIKNLTSGVYVLKINTSKGEIGKKIIVK